MAAHSQQDIQTRDIQTQGDCSPVIVSLNASVAVSCNNKALTKQQAERLLKADLSLLRALSGTTFTANELISKIKQVKITPTITDPVQGGDRFSARVKFTNSGLLPIHNVRWRFELFYLEFETPGKSTVFLPDTLRVEDSIFSTEHPYVSTIIGPPGPNKPSILFPPQHISESINDLDPDGAFTVTFDDTFRENSGENFTKSLLGRASVAVLITYDDGNAKTTHSKEFFFRTKRLSDKNVYWVQSVGP